MMTSLRMEWTPVTAGTDRGLGLPEEWVLPLPVAFPEAFPLRLLELAHCWEGDAPLHHKPGGWAEAALSGPTLSSPPVGEAQKPTG